MERESERNRGGARGDGGFGRSNRTCRHAVIFFFSLRCPERTRAPLALSPRISSTIDAMNQLRGWRAMGTRGKKERAGAARDLGVASARALFWKSCVSVFVFDNTIFLTFFFASISSTPLPSNSEKSPTAPPAKRRCPLSRPRKQSPSRRRPLSPLKRSRKKPRLPPPRSPRPRPPPRSPRPPPRSPPPPSSRRRRRRRRRPR